MRLTPSYCIINRNKKSQMRLLNLPLYHVLKVFLFLFFRLCSIFVDNQHFNFRLLKVLLKNGCMWGVAGSHEKYLN